MTPGRNGQEEEKFEVGQDAIYLLAAVPVMMQVPHFRKRLLQLGADFKAHVKKHPHDFDTERGMFQ
jgi:hypothetical protein